MLLWKHSEKLHGTWHTKTITSCWLSFSKENQQLLQKTGGGPSKFRQALKQPAPRSWLERNGMFRDIRILSPKLLFLGSHLGSHRTKGQLTLHLPPLGVLHWLFSGTGQARDPAWLRSRPKAKGKVEQTPPQIYRAKGVEQQEEEISHPAWITLDPTLPQGCQCPPLYWQIQQTLDNSNCAWSLSYTTDHSFILRTPFLWFWSTIFQFPYLCGFLFQPFWKASPSLNADVPQNSTLGLFLPVHPLHRGSHLLFYHLWADDFQIFLLFRFFSKLQIQIANGLSSYLTGLPNLTKRDLLSPTNMFRLFPRSLSQWMLSLPKPGIYAGKLQVQWPWKFHFVSPPHSFHDPPAVDFIFIPPTPNTHTYLHFSDP